MYRQLFGRHVLANKVMECFNLLDWSEVISAKASAKK